MRLQHILMALLVFLASFIVLTGIAVDLENEWGVTNAELANGSGNASKVVSDMNIFNEQQQVLTNASQYAPGGTAVETPDSTSSATQSTQSSFIMAIKFAGTAMTLPKKIIQSIGGFLGIDPIFLTLLTFWLILTVVFILASAIFYNKL